MLVFTLPSLGTINIPPLPKEKSSDKKKEPPTAPMAVPIAVQVSGGGTVEIPLRIYGRQEQTTSFLIRKGPTQGKIVSLQPVAQEVWILTYQHTAAMNGEPSQQDRILFAAQNKNGTSSAAEIAITITDNLPELATPAAVEFGEIPAGLPVAHLITIANKGGGTLEGSATADAPWTLEPSSYKLRRGEQTQLWLTLAPNAEREYRGHLHFSGDSGVEIPLHAYAYAPFAVTPATLELTERSGSLTLTNRTTAAVTLQVEANPRLHLPDKIVLPPQSTQSITPSLGTDDPAGIDGDIRLSFGGVSRQVHVHADALPAPEPVPTPEPVIATTPTPRPAVPVSSPTPSPGRMAPAHPEITPDVDPEALNTTIVNAIGKPSNLPPIPNIVIVRTTSAGLAEFAWSPPNVPDANTYQIAIRRLSFDPEGKLAQHWIPIPEVQYTVTQDRITALIIGIPPGVRETARITALNPQGEPCAQSLPFPFAVPPQAHLFTGRNCLLAGFFLMLVAGAVLKGLQKIRAA